MKSVPTALSLRYLAALRTNLQRKRLGNGDRAQGVGRAALAGGLVLRDLVRIHQSALLALASSYDFSNAANGSIKRAGEFFAQTLLPIEAAQRATKESNRLLQEKNETLRAHTAALARGNRRLEHEIARRRKGETVILKSKEQYQTLFLESVVMQRKLRQLTHQIISAQEEERKEISRELHDEVVQTLVGINVQLSALGKSASLGLRQLKTKIAHTQRLVENSVKAVHRFARELRPAALDDLGLIPALHAYSKNLATRKQLKVHLTAFAGVEALSNAKRIVLYRVATEALTNVTRHSRATQVAISITEAPGAVQMEITDNGKSFEVEKVLKIKSGKRLGLLGMRERVEMVGGTLSIDSILNQGTTVRARIPFDSKTIT